MALFSKLNAVLDWTAIKAFIDAATDERFIYNEIDTTSGSTVRIQTLIEKIATTPAVYIASRCELSTSAASGVMDGSAIIANTIGFSETSPEAAYTAAKAADKPGV